MKRARLERKTPLKARAPIQRGRPLASSGPVRRAPRTRQHAATLGQVKQRCRYLVVELRDRNGCQLDLRHECGPVQWCHVLSRNDPAAICEPWNSLALCRNAHRWFDAHKGNALHPGEAYAWWAERWPVRAEAARLWRHGTRASGGLESQRERIELAIALHEKQDGGAGSGAPPPCGP